MLIYLISYVYFSFFIIYICVGSFTGIIVGTSSSVVIVLVECHVHPVTCCCISCHGILIYPSSSSIDSVSVFRLCGL